jgi:hypothetical protein
MQSPITPLLSQITISYGVVKCSVVINVIFITVKPHSIVSERTEKIDDACKKTTITVKLRKLPLQGKVFFQITNYQGFRNNQVNLYEFFLLGTYIQTTIRSIIKC